MILEDVCGLLDNNIVGLIHTVIVLLKIAIPILLIIFGMLDFAKGVIAGKEDEIKNGQHMFIKRAISAFLVFFVVTIVQAVIELADDKNSDNESTVWNCANLILNGKESAGNNKNYALDGTKCKTEAAASDYGICMKNNSSSENSKICGTIFKNICDTSEEPLWTRNVEDTAEDIIDNVFDKENMLKEEAIGEINWYGSDVIRNIEDIKQSYYDCLKAQIGYNNCKNYFKGFYEK